MLTRTIDFEICLYRKDLSSSLSSGRAPYERAIRFMADAIYEMTNGAHLLGEVTIFYNCTDLATEMVWVDRVWPNATLNGYGNDLGSHVAMGDTFTFPTPYAALQSGNERGTGYTMAHEWGHYFYGVDDQYANTAVTHASRAARPGPLWYRTVTYQGPCASDMPVNPSVMTNQWNAAAGRLCVAQLLHCGQRNQPQPQLARLSGRQLDHVDSYGSQRSTGHLHQRQFPAPQLFFRTAPLCPARHSHPTP